MIRWNWWGWYHWGLGVRVSFTRRRAYLAIDVLNVGVSIRLGPRPKESER